MKTKSNWSPVLTVLLLAIVSFAFILPKEAETRTSQDILENVLNEEVFVSLEGINDSFEIIDLRNSSAFETGHITNAKNIYITNILTEENLEFFKEIEKEEKQLLLVGENSAAVLPAYKMLYKTGFNNLKIGTVKQCVQKNQFQIENEQLNTAPPNIQEFIESSVKRAEIMKEKPKLVAPKPKKVIPKKKKKKLPIEGGC